MIRRSTSIPWGATSTGDAGARGWRRAASAAAGLVAAGIVGAAAAAGAAPAPPTALAVGWTDQQSGDGQVRAMELDPPFAWQTEAIAVGPEPRLRARGQRLLAASSADESIALIRPRTWTLLRTFDVSAAGGPIDVALASRRDAYFTVADSGQLWHLDLRTGAIGLVADFQDLADDDATAIASGLLAFEDQIFVQLRQQTDDDPSDVRQSYLVAYDVDGFGIEAIPLAGTAAKMKMQLLRRHRILYVSATGGFFDDGGIEAIDIDALESLGLVIAEDDGNVGADLGAFAMRGRRRGHLVFSTDLLLSSHMHAFGPREQVHLPGFSTLLDYFMPAIVLVRSAGALFAPTNDPPGIEAFDFRDGDRLSLEPTATSAAPSDLEAIRR